MAPNKYHRARATTIALELKRARARAGASEKKIYVKITPCDSCRNVAIERSIGQKIKRKKEREKNRGLKKNAESKEIAIAPLWCAARF